MQAPLRDDCAGSPASPAETNFAPAARSSLYCRLALSASLSSASREPRRPAADTLNTHARPIPPTFCLPASLVCHTKRANKLHEVPVRRPRSTAGRRGRHVTRSGTPRAWRDGCLARFLMPKLHWGEVRRGPPLRVCVFERTKSFGRSRSPQYLGKLHDPTRRLNSAPRISQRGRDRLELHRRPSERSLDADQN